MSRTTYEYRYTVSGWYTEAALAEGFIEKAWRGNLQVTISASLHAGFKGVNFFTVRLSQGNKELHRERFKTLAPTRKLFVSICASRKLNHQRYNPQ